MNTQQRNRKAKELLAEVPKTLRAIGDDFHNIARFIEQGDIPLGVRCLKLKFQVVADIYDLAVRLEHLVELQKANDKRKTPRMLEKV